MKDDKLFDLYIHQAKATNLEPGVKYYYRVGDKALESWSAIGEFVTDNGDDNFSFIYMADQQTSSAESPKAIYTMQKAMEKNKNAEFLLNAGDLLNNPTVKEEWSSNLNFKVYGNLTSINTAGTKYEPMLVKDKNNNYIVDPTSGSNTQVNLSNEEIDEYFSKFQKIETPKDENNTNLAMFSSVEVRGKNLIVNSYTVDNKNYGKVKLYNSFAISK